MKEQVESYFKLLKDVELVLYLICKRFTNSCIIRLFQLEFLNNWNGKSITMLLMLLKKMLPEGEALPDTLRKKK